MRFRTFCNHDQFMEMGMDFTPKSGHQGWLLMIPKSVKDVLSVAGGLSKRRVGNMANALQWILTNGLFEAAKARNVFAKEVSQMVGRQVHPTEIFSKSAPDDIQAKRPEIDKIWLEKYEPKRLLVGDNVIDIKELNVALKSAGKTPFYFGGTNGLISYIEAGQWDNSPTFSYDVDDQGPDLSKWSIDTDPNTGVATPSFKHFAPPMNPKEYASEIRKALIDADRFLQTPEGQALAKALKPEQQTMSHGQSFGFDNRTHGVVPADGSEFSPEEYEIVMDYIVAGLHDKGFSDEDIETILIELTGKKPGKRALKFDGRRLKGQFDIPETVRAGKRRNMKLDGVINAGVEVKRAQGEQIPSLDYTIHTQPDVDFSKFAYKQEPSNIRQDLSLEDIHQAYVEAPPEQGGGWRWSNGRKPDENSRQGTLHKGKGNRIVIQKNSHGLWDLQEFDDDNEATFKRCGKGGCGVFFGPSDIKIGTNTQGVGSASFPLPHGKGKAVLDDMARNPEKYGEDHEPTNNPMEISSIRALQDLVKKGLRDKVADNKLWDQDYEGDVANFASQWIINHTADKNFWYGDLENPNSKLVSALGDGAESLIEKAQYALMARKKLQSNNPAEEDTYVPEEVLNLFLTNGRDWRIRQSRSDVQNWLLNKWDSEDRQDITRTKTGDLADADTDREFDTATQYDQEAMIKAIGNKNAKRRPVDAIVGKQNVIKQSPEAFAKQKLAQGEELEKNKQFRAFNFRKKRTFGKVPEYDAAYNLESKKLKGGGRTITIAIQDSLRNMTRLQYPDNIGIADAVYDFLFDLSRNALSKNDMKLTMELAGIINTALSRLKGVENKEFEMAPEDDKFFRDPELANIAKEITSKAQTATKPVSQHVPVNPIVLPAQISDPVQFKAAVQAAFQTGNEQQQIALQKRAAGDPHLMKLYQSVASNADFGFDSTSDEFEEGMISFNRWRQIREQIGTYAVYDGTRPKDGCGFNWWGAAGKPGGVSVKGEVPVKGRKKK